MDLYERGAQPEAPPGGQRDWRTRSPYGRRPAPKCMPPSLSGSMTPYGLAFVPVSP